MSLGRCVVSSEPLMLTDVTSTTVPMTEVALYSVVLATVGGPYLLCCPKVGNPHRPNASLLIGSTWDQHDGSMLGQCKVECRLHVINMIVIVKSLILYITKDLD